jgi:Tol biopolymer transport system component
MSDHRDLIERELDRVEIYPLTLEEFHRYRDRKERNKRVQAGVVALVVAIAGVGAAVRALHPRGRSTPARPASSPLASNGDIAFVRLEGDSGRLYLIDPSGGQVRMLQACPGSCVGMAVASADWSPDGTRIAYSVVATTQSGIGDRAGIYVLDVRTGVSRQLTRCVSPCWRQGGLEGGLDWSPDGSSIAFDEAVGGNCDRAWAFAGSCAIYTVNADGSNRVKLATGSVRDPVGPSWSPDGTHIAVSGRVGENWFVYAMAADGSGLRRLSADRPSQDPTQPAWSPAGSEIAFFVVFGFREAPTCELRAVAPDGSSPKRILDGCGQQGSGGGVWGGLGPEWSPDGTLIAFYDGNGLQVVNPDGTGRVDVATEGMDGGRPSGVVAWQPVPGAPAPASPKDEVFLGTWTSIDVDGSHQTLDIQGSGLGGHLVMSIFDDSATTACGGSPGRLEGSGAVNGESLLMTGTLTCIPGGNPLAGPTSLRFVHDPGTDTLTDESGVTWHRA